MVARVYVTLKSGVLDPQGKAIARSLGTLGFSEVRDVRQGKYIEVTIEGDDKARAAKRVEEMCRQLLANTIIEDFRVEIA